MTLPRKPIPLDDSPSTPVSTGGASGKLLVSYSLLQNLAQELGGAGYQLSDGAEIPGSISGSGELDQAINRFVDKSLEVRGHLHDSLQKTAAHTDQAASEYQKTDQALATK
ncbi:hypothetical protein FHU41_001181 [Psychromicrobium silvestre]|uniref:Uncharacterized protein n=1 Tax=Psychromicrobium silvestre TaxID=1645614 RepID=A0A7Y9LST8_9MICC|nr:hypothetical protein [Psychromicrobium silvestre]NYE94960.1 hypothetical protein [Psychromicrobium silvestre]